MVSISELRNFIKENVREALSAELLKLRALFLPSVSKKKQKDIERLYSKPLRRVAKRTIISFV
jgi:hypothetical protein